MRLDRKNFLATTGAAAAGAAIGFPAIVGAAPEPIRLGSIPCLTGSNALLGQQEHEGVLLAVEEINARPDKVYGGRDSVSLRDLAPEASPDEDRPLLMRQALHAWRLRFKHPRTKQMMNFESEPPREYLATLAMLRRPEP